MTQEQKDSLLKDLCARLPYGVKATFFDIEDECENFDIVEYIYVSNKEHEIGIGQYCLSIDKIKPYLFPLSSMTEEQKRKCGCLHTIIFSCFENDLCEALAELHDFYHKNHLDYRNLIGTGLAIDCTNLNIY